MQIQDFVADVLTDVLRGIRKAQEIDGVGAFVVPAGIGGHNYATHPRVSIGGRLSSTIIDFDVAVTVEESSSVSGGGGVKVAGIGGSMQGDSVSKDTRVSRVQFAVPILLPESQKEWHAELKGNK